MIGTDKKYEAIVIGVSAGGLEALTVLLCDLPADFAIPIIIVQHRAKDEKNLLEEILQAKCKLTVKQADEKEQIEPGKIYFAPANYHLLIEDDHSFSLTSDTFVNYSRPSIDILFETAAEVFRSNLVGIILTGSNSDGAEGIKKIKDFGGATISQDPASADYSYMPQAAVNTNSVNQVLHLNEIKKFILSLEYYGHKI